MVPDFSSPHSPHCVVILHTNTLQSPAEENYAIFTKIDIPRSRLSQPVINWITYVLPSAFQKHVLLCGHFLCSKDSSRPCVILGA
jgi:hypothetical protein